MTLRELLKETILNEKKIFDKNGVWKSTIFTIKCSNSMCKNTVKIEKKKQIGAKCRSCAAQLSSLHGKKSRKWIECSDTNLPNRYLNFYKQNYNKISKVLACSNGKSFAFIMSCTICNKNVKVSDYNKVTDVVCNSCFKKKRPYERTYNAQLRKSARTRSDGFKIEWKLTYSEFAALCEIPNCHYCNQPLERAKNRSNIGSSSKLLDRKNSNDHYTIENSVPCCPRCNDMKGAHLTYDEMIMICKMRGWIT